MNTLILALLAVSGACFALDLLLGHFRFRKADEKLNSKLDKYRYRGF